MPVVINSKRMALVTGIVLFDGAVRTAIVAIVVAVVNICIVTSISKAMCL